MKILYTNAQSIVSKIDELSCVASDMNPDFILLTETWCNEAISEAFLTIPGYDLQQDLRTDREDTAGGRGGGLLVYSKKGMKILALDKTVNFDQYCKFSVNDIKVYLVYRPPNGGAVSISNLTNLIKSVEKGSVLIGDFNLPEIDWQTCHSKGRTREFMEAVKDGLLEQLVDFPTHSRGNVLDLVLTNIPERVTEVTEVGKLGSSDHSMMLATVTTGSENRKEKDGREWHRADWAAMREELRHLDWRAELNEKGSCAAWDHLKRKNSGSDREVCPVQKEEKSQQTSLALPVYTESNKEKEKIVGESQTRRASQGVQRGREKSQKHDQNCKTEI